MSEEKHNRVAKWPLLVSTTAVLICFAVVSLHSCLRIPGQVSEVLAKALRPNISIETNIRTSVERFRSQAKLVVYSAEVSADLIKTNEKRTLWGLVNLGTTSIRIRSLDNKVQYKVNLQGVSEHSFRWDPNSHTMTLHVPQPEIDEDLVEVQTDPAKIEIETRIGWARLSSCSGKFIQEEAYRELRSAVLAQGNTPELLNSARESAQSALRTLTVSSFGTNAPPNFVIQFN